MKNCTGTFYPSESPSDERCLFIFVQSNTCHYCSTLFTQGAASFAAEQSGLKLPAGDRKPRYTTAKQPQPDRLVAFYVVQEHDGFNGFLYLDIQALILKTLSILNHNILQLCKQHILLTYLYLQATCYILSAHKHRKLISHTNTVKEKYLLS